MLTAASGIEKTHLGNLGVIAAVPQAVGSTDIGYIVAVHRGVALVHDDAVQLVHEGLCRPVSHVAGHVQLEAKLNLQPAVPVADNDM